jgi:hypothetical protein
MRMLSFQSLQTFGLFLLSVLHANAVNAQIQQAFLHQSNEHGYIHSPLQVNTQILHPSCSGQLGLLSILAQGGVPPYSYFANGNAVTPSSNLYAGIYTISVYDAASNVVQTQATILNPTPLNMQHCILPPACAACLTPVNIIPSGGTPPYSYFVNAQQGTPPFLLAPGTYAVLVEDANACSITTNIKVPKPIHTNSPIGIKKYLINMDDLIYPNPFQYRLTIQTNNPEMPIGYVQITNLSAQVMYASQHSPTTSHSIDTYSWPPGIYYVVLQNKQQQLIRKTIIKK